MTIRLVSVSIIVNTPSGALQYNTRLSSGLNILSAPNTWGKSTFSQSIIFALGMEGMLSASRLSPLGEALTRVIDASGERRTVVESYVTVTLVNEAGLYLRVRRFAQSSEVGSNLMQTWQAASEAGLESAQRVDTIVREAGSAVREQGFHRVLADYMGWELPLVPTYDDRDVPLYFELLFPLFYVEQKFGWSGIAPRVPTYLRVRDPLRRAVEFILGLTTLDRIRRLNAARQELTEIGKEWDTLVARAAGAVVSRNWRLNFLALTPTSTSQLHASIVEVPWSGDWTPLESAVEVWRAELTELESVPVPSAAEREPRSEVELRTAQERLRGLRVSLNLAQEELTLIEADHDAVAARIASVDRERARLRDLQRLSVLGSDLSPVFFGDARCPTCNQDLDGRAVVTGHVHSLEETIEVRRSERATLVNLQEVLENRRFNAASEVSRNSDAMTETRKLLRNLRDELVAASSTPSVVEVQRRLSLEEALSDAEVVDRTVVAVEEDLEQLAERYEAVRALIAALNSQADGDAADKAILAEFKSRFTEQLVLYGLRSLPPTEVTIDEKALIPTHDGLELAFDVASGMSASDTIRTKWAYYAALLETALGSGRGRHAGLLILDEPRQQETAPDSVAQFVRRLAGSPPGAQVIYVSSEPAEELAQMLGQANVTYIANQGDHLLMKH